MEHTIATDEGEREEVSVGDARMPGALVMPAGAVGLVLFAHGSGSSRRSPRNLMVAGLLNEYRLATLLFDLLSEDEAADRARVFDIDLLARRVVQAVDWSSARGDLAALRLGLFGASTGAAAALVAAAQRPALVAAVVSRGGRPDLAAAALPQVAAPTMLIVGGDDTEVLAMNRRAMQQLQCVKRLEVVPRATHLFEERGALVQVAELAAWWFTSYLVH